MFDDELIDKMRAKADQISQNQVVPRGMKQYAVIWNGMYQLPRGGAGNIAYVGVIWYPKYFTAYQRFVETLIVVDRSRSNDPSLPLESKGLPAGTMTTLFECVPDRTLAGHYWAATCRDTRSILGWFGKPFHRKPSTKDIEQMKEDG